MLLWQAIPFFPRKVNAGVYLRLFDCWRKFVRLFHFQTVWRKSPALPLNFRNDLISYWLWRQADSFNVTTTSHFNFHDGVVTVWVLTHIVFHRCGNTLKLYAFILFEYGICHQNRMWNKIITALQKIESRKTTKVASETTWYGHPVQVLCITIMEALLKHPTRETQRTFLWHMRL
jgi:hypothetical protein